MIRAFVDDKNDEEWVFRTHPLRVLAPHLSRLCRPQYLVVFSQAALSFEVYAMSVE